MAKTKVTVIAEAGVNHNGDMDLARQLIDVAVSADADIVKFQSFVTDQLATREAPKAQYQERTTGTEESQYEMLKRLELSPAMHRDLKSYCEDKGIEFLSTPFDVESLHFLTRELGLQRVKIPSGEATNGPLLLAAARTGAEIILSTGMCDLKDIQGALNMISFGMLNPEGAPDSQSLSTAWEEFVHNENLRRRITVLHCVTEYPAPADSVNLRAMSTIQDTFDVSVGYSDHTAGIYAALASVARGAQIVEKHFTLSKNMAGPDHAASLEPEELSTMIAGIRETEACLGSAEKKRALAEEKNVVIARKSLVAAREIKQGQVITQNDLIAKRPAGGLSPMDYWRLLGKTSDRDYRIDEMLSTDLAEKSTE